jgi:sulfur carrier protein
MQQKGKPAIRGRMGPMLSRIAAAAQAVPHQFRLGDNGAMDILLNGEPRQLAASTTLADLLRAEGLAERRVAVEVNGGIVPRAMHASLQLASGDRVEIVHALGGG